MAVAELPFFLRPSISVLYSTWQYPKVELIIQNKLDKTRISSSGDIFFLSHL
jgi:hypothetical protein